MSQRILERGQIETLDRSDIPRTRLAGIDTAFGRRAGRLRSLAGNSTIGGYLQLLAVVADAQQAILDTLRADPSRVAGPTPAQRQASARARMPPLPASVVPEPTQWQHGLERICVAVAGHAQFPAGVHALVERISAAPATALQAQAQALLDPPGHTAVDAAAAPLIMAALQVWWAALTGQLEADAVQALDVAGVCPLCGSLPVASVVHAHKPYDGYRYLHCSLCACEWHMVRIQCSSCGAMGKDIAYHTLRAADGEDAGAGSVPAVRAETCDGCRSYRKILYMEKDPALDPVADDLATLALDLLLGERGYRRASANPLLWQPAQA